MGFVANMPGDNHDTLFIAGGSLNDIVLTVVTGAVRRFLQRRLVDPRKIDFRVMTPVSVACANDTPLTFALVSVALVRFAWLRSVLPAMLTPVRSAPARLAVGPSR